MWWCACFIIHVTWCDLLTWFPGLEMEATARVHFGQPANWVVLATVGRFLSPQRCFQPVCANKSRYFEASFTILPCLCRCPCCDFLYRSYWRCTKKRWSSPFSSVCGRDLVLPWHRVTTGDHSSNICLVWNGLIVSDKMLRAADSCMADRRAQSLFLPRFGFYIYLALFSSYNVSWLWGAAGDGHFSLIILCFTTVEANF